MAENWYNNTSGNDPVSYIATGRRTSAGSNSGAGEEASYESASGSGRRSASGSASGSARRSSSGRTTGSGRKTSSGKKSSAKKSSGKKASGKKKKEKKGGSLFLPLLLCIIPLIILGVIGFAVVKGYPEQINAYREEAKKLVDASDRDTFVPAKNGGIYDKDNKIISDIATEKIAEYVSYDEIPEEFIEAMISTEDKNFYKHNGVDFSAIIRAGISYLKNGYITQGGSTITMQLARNIFLNANQTMARKIEEAFVAMYMEEKYSKQDIMEFYLNNIYFANGYYGIQAACTGYFSCDLEDLDVSQIAFLCAIPNSPTYYDPIVNKENTITRRNLILKNMLDAGYIEQEAYVSAATEDIDLNISTYADTSAGTHNYVDTYAYHCATLAMMEVEGFEFKYEFSSDSARESYETNYNEVYNQCQSQVYSGKYKLYTSIDMDIQDQLQYNMDMELATFFGMTDDGDYLLQGAGVCIDNSTGYVVAEVGGRTNTNFTGYTLNRAYQSYRQPGSSIKPLIVYTPLFESGDYTPDSYVKDQYIEDGPENASGTYYGTVSVRTAVEMSLNTVAWQLYEQLGPENGLQYLKDMHFSEIVDSDDTIATSIGGFTVGVTPVEMTAAYATLENNGAYRQPTCIRKILDYNDNTIYESNTDALQVYKKDAANTMTDVLEGVINDYSGTGYGLALDNGMTAAGKTGTTDDSKDGWFIGYTPYYTTGIWVGCDTPQAVDSLHGSTYPGKIWQSFMNTIHQGLQAKKFDFEQ